MGSRRLYTDSIRVWVRKSGGLFCWRPRKEAHEYLLWEYMRETPVFGNAVHTRLLLPYSPTYGVVVLTTQNVRVIKI